MSNRLRKILYFLLAFLMIVDFYLIFNAGNPNSLLRFLIKTTSYDVTVTVLMSIGIAVISLIMIRENDQNSVKSILQKNAAYIEKLKKENRSDDEIADSFLREMKAGRFASFLLRGRVKRYISKMK